jgi:LacI family transcriptional regulator
MSPRRSSTENGPNPRPTLADVAKRVGMSKSAVSLALNNRPGSRLSQEAIARIHAAARDLNYRPNPAARSLRLGTTGTVGFISDEVTVTRFASAMIRGILDVADEQERGVLIAETGGHPKQLQRALDSMVDRQVDALIFGSLTARLIDVPALPGHIPTVTVNCRSDDVPMSVFPAEEAAGYAVTRQLLDAGHGDTLGIIGNSLDTTWDPRVSVMIPRRFDGIRRALDEARVVPVAVADLKDWEPSQGYRGARELLESRTPITGLICINDRVAFGAQQALTEHGLRVPDDVSLVSFDDDELAAYMRPPLTTARLPYYEMGRLAMELALAPQEEGGEHLVPMPLRIRSSVRDVSAATVITG